MTSTVSRALAAIVGGYALTSLLILAASLLLPIAGLGQAESVLAASTAGFLVYAGIIMWAYHARSATDAWRLLAWASLPPMILCIVFYDGYAR